MTYSSTADRKPPTLSGKSKGAFAPPEAFKGDKTQDPEDWLAVLNYWITFCAMPQHEAASMFPVLLRDAALVWFQSLEAAVRDDWTQIQAAFLQRFKKPAHIQWQNTHEVFRCDQTSTQSVDEYLNVIMKNMSRAKGLSEATKLDAVIIGLRPDIKQLVIQHRCDSLDDIRKMGSHSGNHNNTR